MRTSQRRVVSKRAEETADAFASLCESLYFEFVRGSASSSVPPEALQLAQALMFASARVPAKPPKSKKLGPKKQALLDKKLAKERYEIKLTSRALRSSLKRMYYPIPRSWGAGIDCDRPLLDDVAFAVAIATDEDDMLPIFATVCVQRVPIGKNSVGL